jgi:dTMP kinase
MEPGKFIVIEGIDGAGTTTQAAKLAQWMRGKGMNVHLTMEPSKGDTGVLIRNILTGKTGLPDRHLGAHALALLFAADRLDHLAREIDPKIREGVHVVSDRYLLSSLAYQSLECETEWVENLNREARPPELTLLLDLDPEISMKRVGSRYLWPELFEEMEIQKKIRKLYLKQVHELYSEQSIIVIDGAPGIEEVHKAIRKEVSLFLERHSL